VKIRLLDRLLGRNPPAERPPALAPRYTEAELLARAEEFNRNADGYWRDLASEPAARAQALNKPFATIPDAASSLYRLGLVLAELRLGVGHTVLDFGAGSCWLSSALNRLGCRTIAVDVSPAALQLGRDLFALDPRHRMELEPLFLPYDGHRLPLQDESVDRIACFDAFHHVPNQDELLQEMFRVLRPGGRAVLAEPGEGHSHADHSQFETERYGVLENDMDIADLAPRARRAGFSRVLLKPYPDPGAIALDADDYLRLMNGDASVYPMADLQQQMRHFYVIALTKGVEVYDTRNPHVLRAEIALPSGAGPLHGRGTAIFEVPVTLRNTGDTLWLHDPRPAGGYVVVAGHLVDETGAIVAREYIPRVHLPRDVAPGESVEATLRVTLPAEVGRYRLRLDLVADKVIWFSQVGSATVDVDVVVDALPEGIAADALVARLEPIADAPLLAAPGTQLIVRVRATNAGSTTWVGSDRPALGAVSLGGHLLDAQGAVAEREVLRVAIGPSLPPGAAVQLEARLTVPVAPGAYQLKLDMVQDGVCWFEQRGSTPLVLPVLVPEGAPDSRNPGVLRALIEPVGGISALFGVRGATVPLTVRVLNTGNTVWLARSDDGRGHVSLGGHLMAEDGALLEVDHVRVPLPDDIPPGATATLAVAVPVPQTAGTYSLQLDMVDEGVAWFGPGGSSTVSVPLVAE
jgi:SAM-dependent methyltransferase